MLDCECGAELIQDDDCETILDVCQEAPVVKDYGTLSNKPQINGVTLDGNKTTADLKIDLDINSAVSAEATLRENADTALGGRIDQEITDRSEAEIALGGRIDGEITNRTNADNALGTRIDNEILARQGGDNNLQTQIDAITSKSDVVDVVATYADLQAYDTQHLGNNDVIKVLDDETHDHSQTYYRWNKPNSTWTYIGSEAPYYSKSQIDTQMAQKQDKLVAGSNIQIASDGKTISATDTTYTAGTGLTLTGTEFSADTTVLATKTEVAPKLQTEVVAELPTTGKESKLYLTPKNYTTGTATGNPITITLGEDAGQITDAKLDGDTYQQSYAGKNLFDTFTETNYFIDLNGNLIAGQTWSVSEYIKVSPNTTYVWHGEQTGTLGGQVIWAGYDSSQAFISGQYAQANNTTSTSFTTGDTTEYVRVGYRNDRLGSMQLELGSTATSYEPYCGGVPSPNPDYPQQIQTVTGTQTVSINGTDYPIDLGSIELCKLSTYQDYIYKDGNDWKLHKAIRESDIDGTVGELSRNGTNRFNIDNINLGWKKKQDAIFCLANSYITVPQYDTNAGFNTGTSNMGYALGLHPNANIIRIKDTNYDNTNDYKTWLGNYPIMLYYVLATPTDTTITDTNLIAQLEAVRNATLQASNTITNTATGTNLAGDLELGYYEYDPQNRYDKWLWLDLNNNYEKLGS